MILSAASYSIKNTLDLHIASEFVYWTDNSTISSYKGVFRAKTDGGLYSGVVTSGIGQRGIQGIAVDWIAGIFTVIFQFCIHAIITIILFFYYKIAVKYSVSHQRMCL